MARILVADDEEGIRSFLAEALELDGHTVVRAADGDAAAKRLDHEAFDLVLTDLKMPGHDGMWLVRHVHAEQPETEVIVLTAHGTVDTAVEAMKLGAFDYLEKPVGSPAELRLLVRRALERRALKNLEARTRRAQIDEPPLTYGDPAMTPVVEAIDKVARTAATVLLVGESGTGKEIAARTIHEKSDRQGQPFMAVNCAALSETLLESELFGHEKGAFTGASERRRGRLELADHGTFFLDEVAEMRPELQARLLRVLQERRFERVGGTRTIVVDVRWIAATNRDLRAEMEAGRFREDLYHRLAVFPIHLPPLRDRRADIVPIADELLRGLCVELKRGPLVLSDEVKAAITAAPWPGNVRELKNALERAAILADGDTVLPEHLFIERTGGGAGTAGDGAATGTLEEMERAAIARALDVNGGNRKRAAAALGIGLRTLYDKLKRYGIG